MTLAFVLYSLSDNKIDADGAQELACGLEFCTELQELE
jgi:hypothetical protein